MIISHGKYTNKLTLYPPAKPILDQETPMWAGNGNNDDEIIQRLFMVDLSLAFKLKLMMIPFVMP